MRNVVILVACSLASCAASAWLVPLSAWIGAPWAVGGLMALAGAVSFVRLAALCAIPDEGPSVTVTRRLAEAHRSLFAACSALFYAGFGTDLALVALRIAHPRELPGWLDATSSGILGFAYGYVVVRSVQLRFLHAGLVRVHRQLGDRSARGARA